MTDDEMRPPGDPEGVRILGADEVEALDPDELAERPRPSRGVPGAPPPREPTSTEPRLRFPLSSSGADESFGPSTGELPHWTEPPTSEVSAVPESDDDWSSFTSGAPRWRDEGEEWADDDDVASFGDDRPRLGALDDSDRDPDDFFSFDEIEPPPGRSVFDTDDVDEGVDETAYDDDGYDDVYDDEPVDDEPRVAAPRKIVVGGGRMAPGNTARAGGNAIGADRDLGQAAMVGIGFLVVAAILFYLGPAAATVLVLGVVTFAAAEFFTAVRKVGYKPAALLGIVGTAGLVLAAYHRGEGGIPLVMVLVVAFSLLWYLVGADEGQATLNIGVTLLGVGWIGLFGAYGAAILGIGENGKGILFGAILCTVGYDTGGYFVGRSAGKSPLSAASPNKTIEGLAGGIMLAIMVGVVYGFLTQPFDSLGDGLKLGLAVAVAAPFGDLCQSMIKRDLGIKDMGAILPGHGGLLDRFDAMLFVLPVVYYVARYSDFFL